MNQVNNNKMNQAAFRAEYGHSTCSKWTSATICARNIKEAIPKALKHAQKLTKENYEEIRLTSIEELNQAIV